MGFTRILGPKWLFMLITLSLLAAVGSNSAQFPQTHTVESGFRLLYELEFEKARATFQLWTKDHPQDPLGPAAEAASYLFQEMASAHCVALYQFPTKIDFLPANSNAGGRTFLLLTLMKDCADPS